MLIASAIKLTNGEIYVGKRHGDCFRNYRDIMLSSKNNWNDELLKQKCKGCIQGFITSSLNFLNREDALEYAKTYNQIDDTVFHELMSEDLW